MTVKCTTIGLTSAPLLCRYDDDGNDNDDAAADAKDQIVLHFTTKDTIFTAFTMWMLYEITPVDSKVHDNLSHTRFTSAALLILCRCFFVSAAAAAAAAVTVDVVVDVVVVDNDDERG